MTVSTPSLFFALQIMTPPIHGGLIHGQIFFVMNNFYLNSSSVVLFLYPLFKW